MLSIFDKLYYTFYIRLKYFICAILHSKFYWNHKRLTQNGEIDSLQRLRYVHERLRAAIKNRASNLHENVTWRNGLILAWERCIVHISKWRQYITYSESGGIISKLRATFACTPCALPAISMRFPCELFASISFYDAHTTSLAPILITEIRLHVITPWFNFLSENEGSIFCNSFFPLQKLYFTQISKYRFRAFVSVTRVS